MTYNQLDAVMIIFKWFSIAVGIMFTDFFTIHYENKIIKVFRFIFKWYRRIVMTILSITFIFILLLLWETRK